MQVPQVMKYVMKVATQVKFMMQSSKWIEICSRMKSSKELGTEIYICGMSGPKVANEIICPLEVWNEITATTEVWNEMESVV